MIYIIVGSTGTGKTTLVKSLIKGKEKNTLVFDPNYSYSECVQIDCPYKLVNIALKSNNKNIIFEEATAYFVGAREKELRNLLIRHRHLKHNIFLIYHFLNSIPPTVFAVCNYFIIFKTLDKYNLYLPFEIPTIKEKFKFKILKIN
jgi:DNA helicase HerA-like ATPase